MPFFAYAFVCIALSAPALATTLVYRYSLDCRRMNSTPMRCAAIAFGLTLLAACTSVVHPPAVAASSAATPRQCTPPPLASTLYLRGTMNTWTTQELDAFVYDCDAYTLDVDFTGPQEFRIGDEKLSGGLSFGTPRSAKTPLQVNQVFAIAQADSTN